MSRRNNPNTQPTPENGPNTPELSADMSREELLEYYGHKIDRVEAVAEAANFDGESWADENGFFQSGAALHNIVENITNDPDYVPTETDVLIARYIDADLKETTASLSIDEDALLEKYAGKATTGDEAILLHIDAIKKDLSKHNTKIGNKLKDGTRLEPTTPVPYNPEVRPLSNTDKNNLQGNRQKNNKIIGDITAADTVLGSEDLTMTAATFIDLANRHAAGDIDDETFDLAKAELASNTTLLSRAADAYLLVAGAPDDDFVNSTFVEALGLDRDDERQHTIDDQQRARKKASEPLMPQEPVIKLPHPPREPKGKTDAGTQKAESKPDSKQPDQPETGKSRQQRLEWQKLRVQNAAQALQASGLRRSRTFVGGEFSDAEAGDLHAAFNQEVYKLMQLERPAALDDPETTPEEKNAFIAQYAFNHYHDVTMKTVEAMGGEKDPKKRKRTARLIRLGGVGLGFVLGGPAGAAVGGAIGLGISKALDSEMKSRDKLKDAVQNYAAQSAADAYSTALGDNEEYDELEAFKAATANLHKNYENGLVKQRRRNIGMAGLKGAAWTGGSLLVFSQAAEAAHVMGDTMYQWVSQASWSGTHTSWAGGLNPNFNYTMHEKPVSWKLLSGLWNAASSNTVGATLAIGGAGASVLAGRKALEEKKRREAKGQRGTRTLTNA